MNEPMPSVRQKVKEPSVGSDSIDDGAELPVTGITSPPS